LAINLKNKGQVTKYIILSIIALVLILLIGFIGQSKTVTILDKLIVGVIFIISLLFGISLAIRPGWYKRQNKNKGKDISKYKPVSQFKGHHPNCDEFAGHIINIKNKTYCAGCLGLIIGSVVTIILILIYLLSDVSLINFQIFLLIGILLIFTLFIVIIFFKRNPTIRVLSNSIFVFSFFIIVISILEITGTYVYGLLTGLFSFLLVDTRIQISKWSHINTCKNCKKECKMY
jgi:hypothetical protein